LIDTLILLQLFLGNCPFPQETYTSQEYIEQIVGVNYGFIIPVLERFVHKCLQRGSGGVIGVSVARERGRASNDLCGIGKAGSTAYLSGI
jgi:hypothetical protein